MTTTSQTPAAPAEWTVRLDIETHGAGFVRALAHLDHAVTKQLDRVDFDPRLRELVRLRASQLNGCGYCVDMHSTDARAIGESERRLAAIPVWRDTPFFDARERAALSFTEAVTLTAVDHVPERAWDEVAAAFSADEIAALVGLITAINAWNATSVATRAWRPGSYER